MNVEDCFQVGYISRAHGIKGEIRAVLDVDDIDAYKKKASVFLQIEGKLTLFHVQTLRIVSNREVLIKFDTVDDRNRSEEITGSALYLPLSELPPLSGNQFYYHEIVNFQVEDRTLGNLGPVKGVREMSGQDLVVMQYEGQEILIPIADEIVIRADRERKVLITQLPEGLLDVFLT